MFCKACGKEVMNTAVICTGCGSSTTGSGVGMSEESINKLIILGWIGAFLIPILGIVLGIILCVKSKIGHGVAQIIVSIFSWIFWAAFLTSCFAAMAANS